MDGPAAGRSARVLRYQYGSTGQALFYLMFIDSDRHYSSAELNVQPTHTAVLNGQPFNGTGVGYDPGVSTGARLVANENVYEVNSSSYLPRPLALMPNAAFFFPDLVQPQSNDPNDFLPLGRLNTISLDQTEKQRLVALRGIGGLGGGRRIVRSG